MGLFKRGKVWWISFSYKGRQIRRSTETENKKLAEMIQAKILTQIAEGKWLEKTIDKDKSFNEMMEKYLSEYSISKTQSGQIRDIGIDKEPLLFLQWLQAQQNNPSANS